MSIEDEITRKTASQIADSFDQVIFEAVDKVTDSRRLSASEMMRRGSVARMPDGTEVFSFDGVEMVRFHPLEFKTEDIGCKIVTTTTRRYQVV